jgi:glutamyl-tRNA synthetase
MHLGNARTALLAWLQVRRAGGTIVMRVEDLDAQRVVDGAEARMLDEMKWLGLDWDEGPVRQSERAERYRAAASELVAKGLAYECACSRTEIAAAASAPHGDEPRYPGICRELPPENVRARAAAAGRKTALRYRASERIGFEDLVRGAVEPVGVDDFVIVRSDGVAAYQLAVVVDDAAMGVTDVLRADDLLGSTPRQIALYRSFGLPVPRFAHVPLVLSPEGERLAKRNRPASVGDLRARGVTPEAIVGALASSAGLAPAGTAAMPHELVKDFDLTRLAREPAVVDL